MASAASTGAGSVESRGVLFQLPWLVVVSAIRGGAVLTRNDRRRTFCSGRKKPVHQSAIHRRYAYPQPRRRKAVHSSCKNDLHTLSRHAVGSMRISIDRIICVRLVRHCMENRIR